MVRESLTREQHSALKDECVRLLRKAEIREEAIQSLASTDFFVAPASTRFHGVYVGGLLDHSLGVLDWLLALNSQVPDPCTEATCIKVAMLHDLCKVNVYKQVTKRRKVGEKWEDYQGYDFVEDYPLGHGEKSLDRALMLGVPLTKHEKLAIRHHMGAYELTGMPLKAYQEAVRQCPLVLLLHTADMMETLYGRRDNG